MNKPRGKTAITILVDKERHSGLVTAARKHGMSLAAFMRHAAFKEVDKVLGGEAK